VFRLAGPVPELKIKVEFNMIFFKERSACISLIPVQQSHKKDKFYLVFYTVPVAVSLPLEKKARLNPDWG
jgi:hypothetical protein